MNYWEDFIKKTYRFLIYLGIFLILVFVIFQIMSGFLPDFNDTYVFKLFDLGAETNFPTYYSALLFITLAIISWFIAGVEKKNNRSYFPWIFTIFLFLFLGLDEFAQIHEQLTGPFQSILNTGGFLFFAWVIPYGIILILLSIYYIPFILKLKNRNLLFIGIATFLFGAIVLEMIGSNLYEAGKNTDLIYVVISSLEEVLELAGLLIAIYAFKKELVLKILNDKIIL